MEAKEYSLKGILSKEPHKLEVPFFQRRYVWKEENWEELLEVIKNSETEKIFWGSIIVKKVRVSGIDKQCTKGYIIDGQQRLTTISLLTKAIYDSVSDEKKASLWDIMKACIYYPLTAWCDPKNINDYDIVIDHSRYDKQDFESVIKPGIFDNDKIHIEYQCQMKDSQIKKCYAYYRNVLKDMDDEQLRKLWEVLYSDDKVFVYIELDENDINEQKIFDSINRAGQKLYTSDIIKNNLFKKMHEKMNDTVRVGRLCDTNWDAIFWLDGAVDNFWDDKRQFGNVSKSHLDFLLYCVACMEWSEVDVKRINEKLELVYEEKTATYDAEQLRDLSEKIAKIALIYKKYIIDFANEIEDEVFRKDEDVKRLLLIMEKFNIQMFYPYLLKRLFDNLVSCDIEQRAVICNLKDEELRRDCRLLEAYLMRRRICGTGTSKYSNTCSELLRNGIEEFIKSLDDNYIENENNEIKEALKDVNQEMAKMVLYCLELSKWDDKDDLGQFSYNFHVEHIMPRSWEKYWPLELTGEKEQDEKLETIRNNAVKEIGNRLLLSKKLNSQLSNREFVTKMEGESATGKKKKKEGYKEKTQMKLTKALIDRYVAGDRVWDEEHISKRTSELTKQLISLWDYRRLSNEGVGEWGEMFENSK